MNKLAFLFLTIFACASLMAAQSASTSRDWKGFYVGGNASASGDKTDASETLLINQGSGVFVAGRGRHHSRHDTRFCRVQAQN